MPEDWTLVIIVKDFAMFVSTVGRYVSTQLMSPLGQQTIPHTIFTRSGNMIMVYSTVRPHNPLGVLTLALVANVIHFISPESTLCLFIVSQVRAHLRSASDPHFS
jgi:hypothetical protein